MWMLCFPKTTITSVGDFSKGGDVSGIVKDVFEVEESVFWFFVDVKDDPLSIEVGVGDWYFGFCPVIVYRMC